MFNTLCLILLIFVAVPGDATPTFRCDYSYESDAGWFKLIDIPSDYDHAVVRCYGEGDAAPTFRCDYTFERDAGWFKLIHIPSDYEHAVVRCYGEGAVLASPSNEKMVKIMMSYMKEYELPDSGVLTGMHAELGNFLSLEGVNLKNMEVGWDQGQPDNYKNNEDCVNLRTNGKLDDVPCSKFSPYICFKKYEKLYWNSACGTTTKGYQLLQMYQNKKWNAKPTKQKVEPCLKYHDRYVIFDEAFRTCTLEGGRLLIPHWVLGKLYMKNKRDYDYNYMNYYFYLSNHGDITTPAWIGAASEYFTFEKGLFSYMNGEYIDCYDSRLYDTYPSNYFYDFWYHKSHPDYVNPKLCVTLERPSESGVKAVDFLNPFKNPPGITLDYCFHKHKFICEKSPISLTNCSFFISNPQKVAYTAESHEDYKFRCDYAYFKDGQGWYKLHQVPATFAEAVRVCHMEGTKIASPLYKARADIMMEIMNEKQIEANGIWAGIHATISPGLFHTVDGGWPLHKIKHTWDEEQPDNLNGNQNCLVFRPNGRFSDEYCNDVYPYICYKKFEKLERIGMCGTTDPDFVMYGTLTNCYKVNTIPRVWDEAKISCTAQGGYLAIVNNKTELDIIKKIAKDNDYSTQRGGFLKEHEHRMYYIGFSKNLAGIKDQEWRTLDARTLKDAGYDTIYKSAWPDAGECGIVSQDYNELYYANCSRLRKYICEKNPETLVACYKAKSKFSDEENP